MTPLLLLLALVQAGLLLWSAVLLGNVGLRRKVGASLVFGLTALALAMIFTRYADALDPLRVLCAPADCLVLVLSVACVRVLVVSKEAERLLEEHQQAQRLAAEAAAAELRSFEEERIRAAAAALEAHKARLNERAAQSSPEQRHLTPSKLRGGARSPRFPTAPRK